MIFRKKTQSVYQAPFQAVKSSNSIGFVDGFIFDLDKNSDSSDFPESCLFHKPNNIDEFFSFSSGDEFYLRIDLNKLNLSTILQNPGEIKGSSRYRYIKICSIRSDLSIDQHLTQNIFLTDKNQEKAFEIVKTGRVVNRKAQYRVNGGWVICLETPTAEFLDEVYFEYDDDKPFINGVSKYVYLELKYRVSTSIETGEDEEEGIGSVGSYSLVSGAKQTSARIVVSDRAIESERASAKSKSGTYYLLLSTGNLYIGAGELNSGLSLWGLGDIDTPPNYPGVWSPVGDSKDGTSAGWYGWVQGGGLSDSRASSLWERVTKEDYEGPTIFNIIPYQQGWNSFLSIGYV